MNSYRHKANSAASAGQNGTEFYTVMTANRKPHKVYYGALLVSKERLLWRPTGVKKIFTVATYWCQENISYGDLLVSEEHLLWRPTGVTKPLLWRPTGVKRTVCSYVHIVLNVTTSY